MTGGLVPMRRPEPTEALVRVAAPVSTLTWNSAAYLANWLRGKGAQLVPWCFPERTITSTNTETFRFYTKPRTSAIERVWGVLLSTTSSARVTADVKVPASGTAQTVIVSSSAELRVPYVFVETLGAKSGTAGQIDMSIKANGGNLVVEGIACYEQDRPYLATDSTDYGIDVATTQSGQPIFYSANQSYRGVVQALENADARRTGIFHWSVGDSTSCAQSSATPTTIFTHGVPVLGRFQYTGSTTSSVKWAAYCKVNAAGSGTITATTSSSSVNDPLTVNWTSYQWSTPRAISIHAEDLTATDGRRSSAWDELNFSIAGDGTRTLTVQSISVWDDTTP